MIFPPISVCWDTLKSPTCYGLKPTSAANMREYICVEMPNYLAVGVLLFWVIVTQSFMVQELESQSAIRNGQHLLLIKQRLNATEVRKPHKSPQLVNLCLPTEVWGGWYVLSGLLTQNNRYDFSVGAALQSTFDLRNLEKKLIFETSQNPEGSLI